MSVDFESLTAEDRAAIVAEVERIHAMPAPVNTSSAGCAMFLIAFALFVAGPFVWGRVAGLTVPFFVVEGVLVVMGLIWYFRGSGGAYGKTVIRAEQAIETIKGTCASARGRECGEAVARLLASSSYSDGPGTSSTFKVEEARQQLGPAMPFVLAVENFQISEGKADPVFTLHERARNAQPHA